MPRVQSRNFTAAVIMAYSASSHPGDCAAQSSKCRQKRWSALRPLLTERLLSHKMRHYDSLLTQGGNFHAI
jgi:hypothetical protein